MRRLGELDLLGRQAVVLHLLRDQVLERDLQLLFLGVAGELEDFHAVAQRRRNRVEDVGRREEQDLGQIERHVEVVIAERVVLLRVEHLEQRRRRVAAEVGPELVDLVEDEDRVLRLGAAQPLDDLAGQRADVGAAVAADLRLVAHAAERDAHELPADRVRDRSRQRRLADARRAEEAQDRPLDVRIELAHGEVLEDAILDLLEARVVGVEHLLGVLQVDRVFGALRPRQRDQPVDVGARHGVLGGGDRHLREAIELAQRFLLDAVGHAGRFDLAAQLLDFLGLLVAFAELLLDRLHLLAQEVLALVLADLGLHLRLDARSELEDLELLDQDPVQRVHPRADVERRQDLLLHRRADGRQARRDEVGELAGIGDVGGERLEVVGQQRRQRDDLLEIALDVALERVDLEVILVAALVGGHGDRGAQVRPGLDDAIERDALDALHDQPQAAVGQLEHLVDVGRGADRIQVFLQRLFDRGLALREDADQLAGGVGLFDQAHRCLARDRQRHERIGEQDGVAERQYRQFGGNLERPFGVRRDSSPDGRSSSLSVIGIGPPVAGQLTRSCVSPACR